MTETTDTLRTPRLPDVVADHIEAYVFERGLVAGDQLPTEAQLVEQYDVSRTVVREAARVLEQRGLVDIRPGRGMVVSKIDGAPVVRQYALLLKANPAAFEQLMDVRLLVEVHIAGLAARNHSNNDLLAIQTTLDQVRGNRDDFDLCLNEDLRFHTLVGQACGNPLMSLYVDPVNECLRETYRIPFGYMARLESTIEEHQAILDAITHGDADSAREAAREHLERVKQFTGWTGKA